MAAARNPIRSLVYAFLCIAVGALGSSEAFKPVYGLHEEAHGHHEHDLEPLPPPAKLAAIQAAVRANEGRADPTGRAGSGGTAVAYRPGSPVIRSGPAAENAPAVRLFRTGYLGTEPTLGVNKAGHVFVQATTYNGVLYGSKVIRSTDQGRSWVDVSPRGPFEHVYSQDPYLYLDPVTGRVFTDDLLYPCQELSRSDDGGRSWITTVVGCEIADHQNIFAGPPPPSGARPFGYPNVVYNCAIGIGSGWPTATGTTCLKSLDGGTIFAPTGQLAYTPDPRAGPGSAGIPGFCDGAPAHGFVGQDGTVYLPMGWCGQPYLSISENEGLTWKRVQVATNGMNEGTYAGLLLQDHEAGVVADRGGNLYYFWVAKDYLPYLAVSRDRGTTWSKPVMVAPPGLRQAALPALAIGMTGAPGRIALAYMGSTNAPRNPYPRTERSYRGVEWNGYISMSVNALSPNPVFYTAPVNDPGDPLVKGLCGPVRCEAEFDFIDVQVGPNGTPWATWVDGCFDGRCHDVGEAIVGRLVGGPSLG